MDPLILKQSLELDSAGTSEKEQQQDMKSPGGRRVADDSSDTNDG